MLFNSSNKLVIKHVLKNITRTVYIIVIIIIITIIYRVMMTCLEAKNYKAESSTSVTTLLKLSE